MIAVLLWQGMGGIAWVPAGMVIAVVLATIALGAYATRISRTASDFFVAGRAVNVFWNASAISGEYLSAASFMGVAGLVMKNGYDALWLPIGYAAGYLFLLLFIAGLTEVNVNVDQSGRDEAAVGIDDFVSFAEVGAD